MNITINKEGLADFYTCHTDRRQWQIVGTVTRNGCDTGALLRSKHTGLYCQANGGAFRSLPQKKIKELLNA